MGNNVRIAFDAMGGDLGPAAAVEGALLALSKYDDMTIILTGREEEIMKALEGKEYDKERLSVVNADDVITNDDPPVEAIMKKKDSSMVKALKMLKSGEADAVLSSGSTGALLTGGMGIAGRIKGVRRSPLAPLIPTLKGMALLVDCGANVDCKPEDIVQFAKMGSVYFSEYMDKKDPVVKIVNVGAEEEKGNQMTKEAYALLKECPDINFGGNIEARDIPAGAADIIVCDAFVGNVIMKMYEGVADAFLSIIKGAIYSGTLSKIGGALIKKPLKEALKGFKSSDYGGAPMLGLNGLVVKAHGNSNANAFSIALGQCYDFVKKDIRGKTEEKFGAIREEDKKA
ncbi:MAG: phosphate acyltransferase PlsX [Lachnospiraceae bacterium]|nr:phosphate acyltransferase PlsX [Lachnospiraceae bacterium]